MSKVDFSDCNSLVALSNKAKQYREAGVDVMLINSEFSKRKREIAELVRTSKVSINKVSVRHILEGTTKYSHLGINFGGDLSSPLITYDSTANVISI